MSLENKRVIVTGGASGIGRSTVGLLRSRGADVVVADIADPGDEPQFLACDVSDGPSVAAMVEAAVAQLGDQLGQTGPDALRILGGFMVLFSHSFPLTANAEPTPFMLGEARVTLGTAGVILFFTASGFLVSSSWTRSTATCSVRVPRPRPVRGPTPSNCRRLI